MDGRGALTLSLQAEATRLAEEVGKRVPHVTVLFNNAGWVYCISSAPQISDLASRTECTLDRSRSQVLLMLRSIGRRTSTP